MLNIERLQAKGQLADLNKKKRDLQTEISGQIVLIRSLLNPYLEEVDLIDSEKTLVSAKRLNELVCELKIVKHKIAELEEWLG